MKLFFPTAFLRMLKALKKKYPNAKKNLLEELEKFDQENAIRIGKSIYKIRIQSSDMKKGKSSGYRCYMYVRFKKNILIPLSIYPKNTRESISNNEIYFLQTQAELELSEHLFNLSK
jgi:mRNA-degrading endonuclease RelE of RelBE toxin-antitoxin system